MCKQTHTELITLDRDGGVDQHSENYIKTPEEWFPVPESLEAIVRLRNANYRVVITTNQSGIERGLFDLAAFNTIHQVVNRQLGRLGGCIGGVFFRILNSGEVPADVPVLENLASVSEAQYSNTGQ